MTDPRETSKIKVASDVTPENVRETIPIYKTIGLERTELLEFVDPKIWTCIIPDLLNWCLDVNWPSTHVIMPMLVSNPITITATIPHVDGVLRQVDPRDDEQQSLLISWFCLELEMPLLGRLYEALRFFRKHSTPELERDWGWTENVDTCIARIENWMPPAGPG